MRCGELCGVSFLDIGGGSSVLLEAIVIVAAASASCEGIRESGKDEGSSLGQLRPDGADDGPGEIFSTC